MKYPHSLIAFAVASGVGAVGCYDAGDAYDDYKDRVFDAAPEVDIDGGIVSTLPDVDGEFYLVARPAGLGEKRLFHLRVTFTMTPVTENTATLDYAAYFLDYQTLEPVGDEVIEQGIEVSSDASYDAPLEGTVPAAANSVSGTNAEMDGVLVGTIVSEDFLCGTATGTAGALSLDGTEWAAVRITGDTLPPPVWRCEDQP